MLTTKTAALSTQEVAAGISDPGIIHKSGSHPDYGIEKGPQQTRVHRGDHEREAEDRKQMRNTLILNRKIYMHQRKIRDLYIIDATPEKVITSYDRIEKIEHDPMEVLLSYTQTARDTT